MGLPPYLQVLGQPSSMRQQRPNHRTFHPTRPRLYTVKRQKVTISTLRRTRMGPNEEGALKVKTAKAHQTSVLGSVETPLEPSAMYVLHRQCLPRTESRLCCTYIQTSSQASVATAVPTNVTTRLRRTRTEGSISTSSIDSAVPQPEVRSHHGADSQPTSQPPDSDQMIPQPRRPSRTSSMNSIRSKFASTVRSLTRDSHGPELCYRITMYLLRSTFSIPPPTYRLLGAAVDRSRIC